MKRETRDKKTDKGTERQREDAHSKLWGLKKGLSLSLALFLYLLPATVRWSFFFGSASSFTVSLLSPRSAAPLPFFFCAALSFVSHCRPGGKATEQRLRASADQQAWEACLPVRAQLPRVVVQSHHHTKKEVGFPFCSFTWHSVFRSSPLALSKRKRGKSTLRRVSQRGLLSRLQRSSVAFDQSPTTCSPKSSSPQPPHSLLSHLHICSTLHNTSAYTLQLRGTDSRASSAAPLSLTNHNSPCPATAKHACWTPRSHVKR